MEAVTADSSSAIGISWSPGQYFEGIIISPKENHSLCASNGLGVVVGKC